MDSNEWNGVGLPPVGITCRIPEDTNHHEYYAHYAGREAFIIAHDVNCSDNPCAVYWVLDDEGFKEYHALTADHGNFEPVTSS